MKLPATVLMVVACIVLKPVNLAAQTPVAEVSFAFERFGVETPRYTLRVGEDGSAHYEAEQVLSVGRGGRTETDVAPATQQVERELTLSAGTTKRIFAAARELDRFDIPCASKAKNIADTGKKMLRYTGEDGNGSCTYNYAQDKRVVILTETFEAIAATLDLGRKLDFDHRFDRLGLDAVMAQLVEEANAGRAIELGTIAASLRSIAEDADLLERVRNRAAKLLQQAPPAL